MKIFLSIFFLFAVISMFAQNERFDSIRTRPIPTKIVGVNLNYAAEGKIDSSNKRICLCCKTDTSKHVLIILNDKKIGVDKFGKVNPQKITSIIVLNKTEAVKKYGEEAKDGAILLSTKKVKS